MDASAFMPDASLQAAIEKDVENFNRRRRVAVVEVDRRRKGLFVAYGLGIALVLFILYRFFSETEIGRNFMIFTVVMGAVGIPWVLKLAREPGRRVQQEFRDHMLPVILGFLDDFRYRNGFRPASFERVPKTLLGSYNRETFDDFITCRIDGTAVDIFEVKLERTSKNSSRIIFQGVIMACQVEGAFPGRLLASRRDTGWAFLRAIFERDTLMEMRSHTPLDDSYQFKTDAPEAAGQWLRGGLSETLIWLRERWPRAMPMLALNRGDLYLLLPTERDFFAMPPIDRPLDYTADLKPMVDEIASLLAIVRAFRRPVAA